MNAPSAPADRMTTVRIPQDLAERLAAVAEREGVTRSALLTEVIQTVASGAFVPAPRQPEVRVNVRTVGEVVDRAAAVAKVATGSERGLNSVLVEALAARLVEPKKGRKN